MSRLIKYLVLTELLQFKVLQVLKIYFFRNEVYMQKQNKVFESETKYWKTKKLKKSLR